MRAKSFPRLFSTVDPKEMSNFASFDWWSKAQNLHKLTDLRIQYLIKAFSLDYPLPFKGMKVIDIGCGGGIFSERLARLGADVTGVDPNTKAVQAARHHHENHAGTITGKLQYKNAEVSEVTELYDLVIASEVIEHTTDPRLFLSQVASRMKPGGWTFLSAPNKTFWSWLYVYQLAEILGYIEKGTHHWDKFIKPEELTEMLRGEGLEVKEKVGCRYDLITGTFVLDKDDSLSYFMIAHRNK